MNTKFSEVELKSVDELRQSVKGAVFNAADAGGYDAERLAWNMTVD